MNYTVPSLPRLMAAFPSLTRETLVALRRALKSNRRATAAELFGDELLTLRGEGTRTWGQFFNAGDTYAVTLGKYHGSSRWMLTTMGDMVEQLEARGRRVI